MDVSDRFASLVQGAPENIHLDLGSALIAAHAHPQLDPTAVLAELDALAEKVPDPTLESVCGYLFDELGFVGNVDHYEDPANSFIDDVLARRTGIPISLSVVLVEVGRRVGLDLDAVGMPGHVLVRDREEPPTFVDAFGGGRRVDAEGAHRIFTAVTGGRPFVPSYLDPVDGRVVLARMLANLKMIYRNRTDRAALEWVLRLRVAIPGVPATERKELAAVLAASGGFDRAASELERLADDDPGQRDDHLAAAERLRARLN
ncbi:MAG: transglutaminase-like domain-containing protein [Actinomycetota bacterium]|nr:transglutaminase-like domain-containing protein [Actinomycetota bacterium]